MQRFELKAPHKFCQDWEIGVSNYQRVNEFVNYYIHNLRSDDEKVSLFMIIVSSFDYT